MRPSSYSLRPATAQDIWPIRWLVFTAGLDPTQIRWSQFWVAEAQGQIIACGQLRTFAAAQELGSLVVARRYRHQGIGRLLAQQLIQQATQPLYLECLGQKLVKFYQSLGFVKTELSQLPPALKRKFALTNRLAQTFQLPLILMKYDQ
jgi:amino-acid N-acetyltransferase